MHDQRNPNAILEISLESMRLTLVNAISSHFCEDEIKKAVDRAITPKVLAAKIANAIENELDRFAASVAQDVLYKNTKMKEHLSDVCKREIEERLENYRKYGS